MSRESRGSCTHRSTLARDSSHAHVTWQQGGYLLVMLRMQHDEAHEGAAERPLVLALFKHDAFQQQQHEAGQGAGVAVRRVAGKSREKQRQRASFKMPTRHALTLTLGWMRCAR